jgi:hypothetical protein
MLTKILLAAVFVTGAGETQRPQKCWVESRDYFTGKQIGWSDRMSRIDADRFKAYGQIYDPFVKHEVRCEGEFET